MRLQLPEVRDIAMPPEGVFHNLILVAIRKSYPGHARKVMHAIWGLGQAMFSKCIVVVDEDVDVQNYREVAWKALNHIDPERDIQFVLGPVDSLDHSSRLPNYGSKMGVDATRKWPGEGFTRPWPGEIRMSEDVKRRVDELWKRRGCSYSRDPTGAIRGSGRNRGHGCTSQRRVQWRARPNAHPSRGDHGTVPSARGRLRWASGAHPVWGR